MVRCFYHKDKNAVAHCLSCQKYLCEKCIYKSKIGIVCSEMCKKKLESFYLTHSHLQILAHGNTPFYKHEYSWWFSLLSIIALLLLISWSFIGVEKAKKMIMMFIEWFLALD